MSFEHPFGEKSCEDEIRLLGERYQEYYFDHAPFNEEVLLPRSYLVVGRRGSGKTSLSHYFRFQRSYKNATSLAITSEELPQIYLDFQTCYLHTHATSELLIPFLSKVWELFIWGRILESRNPKDPATHLVRNAVKTEHGFRGAVRSVIADLLKKFLGIGVDAVDKILGDCKTFDTNYIGVNEHKIVSSDC